MANITRLDSNARLSRVVIHGDTVYVAGITSSVKGDIVEQTRDVFRLAPFFFNAAAQGRLYGQRLEGLWLHVGAPDAVGEAERAIARSTN